MVSYFFNELVEELANHGFSGGIDDALTEGGNDAAYLDIAVVIERGAVVGRLELHEAFAFDEGEHEVAFD